MEAGHEEVKGVESRIILSVPSPQISAQAGHNLQHVAEMEIQNHTGAAKIHKMAARNSEHAVQNTSGSHGQRMQDKSASSEQAHGAWTREDSCLTGCGRELLEAI